MTRFLIAFPTFTPAEAGVQADPTWMPAFAGMTMEVWSTGAVCVAGAVWVMPGDRA